MMRLRTNERRCGLVNLLLLLLMLAVCLMSVGCTEDQVPYELKDRLITLSADDRILVLAPHPDDDIIGCGGLIQEAVAKSIPVNVVYLTYGDNNEWSFMIYRKRPVLLPRAVRRMGEVRRDEAVAACERLGLSRENLTFLGYPDFGTFKIWTGHWNNAKASRGMLTRARSVPYADAYRTGAAFRGDDILADLTAIIGEFKPTRIFVSHPADSNTDHRAMYLFTRVALWDLAATLNPTPTLHPYIVHHPQWPRPRGLHPELPLLPPRSLCDRVDWKGFLVTPETAARKHEALRAHRSQYAYSRGYLRSFVRGNELFGDFPDVPLLTGNEPVHLGERAGEHIDLHHPHPSLTDEEKSHYVDLEWRTAYVRDGSLQLTVGISREMGDDVHASVYLFGYRHDQPFATMPKIRIKLTRRQFQVFDQKKAVAGFPVNIERADGYITLSVPLHALGSPDRVLANAAVYHDEVPLDAVAWRALELQPQPTR